MALRFGIVKAEKQEKRTLREGDEKLHQPLGEDHYHKIEKAIGYQFKDSSWLAKALTHRSAPQDGSRNDYERLEFLGDAVLDLAVAHLLSDRHPEAREGELSKMRAALVNTVSLAGLAKKIGLGPYIKLGRGELSSGGYDRPSILADVFEAMVGAVYRDSGYERALKCIELVFGHDISDVTPRDPKTELQEALHAVGSEPPSYLLECVEGPEHAPTFISVVEVDGEIVGRGRGPTKKASQQLAASQALEKLAESDSIDEMMSDSASENSGQAAFESGDQGEQGSEDEDSDEQAQS